MQADRSFCRLSWLFLSVSVVLQVRQHVPHKRTFFYLEQLILKFNADANCLSMKEIHEVMCHVTSFQLLLHTQLVGTIIVAIL